MHTNPFNTVCGITNTSRRRVFWSTQACGSYDDCGTECGSYGMILLRGGTCGDGCDNTQEAGCKPEAVEVPRSISTSNWAAGLMVNILMTDGVQPDSECGFKPGTRGGHWSSSFLPGGTTANAFGSNIRAVPAGTTIAKTTAAIQVEAELAAAKLVEYGVALSTDTTTSYLGRNRYGVNIKIYGQDGSSYNVGITGTRLTNSIVWST